MTNGGGVVIDDSVMVESDTRRFDGALLKLTKATTAWKKSTSQGDDSGFLYKDPFAL
jgi:hypothetical protein